MSLSLGGGQGNGTTDPSADSDLKGHEVGTRSAEPHDILSPAFRDKPEISKLSWPIRTFPKTRWLAQISKDWRMNVCVGFRLSMKAR